MYQGIVQAVLSRLQGQPPTFVAPLEDADVAGGTTRVKAGVTLLTGVEVPIYYLDASGQDMSNLWPCLTFDIISVTPRFDEGAVYQSDTYQGDFAKEDVTFSKSKVTDTNGESIGYGVMLTRMRPVMHPYDVLVQIQAMTDDPNFSAQLTSYVYERFPPRGAIRVAMKNGSYRVWDMMFRDFQDLDSRQAVQNGRTGFQRQYTKNWTYNVEAFLDNTDQAKLVNTIRSRTVNQKKA